MSVNKFKVGDVVKCVDAGVYTNLPLTIGKDYVLLDVDGAGDIQVENDKGSCFYYYSYRFELSNGEVSSQPPKFKDGDMVYLIRFGCLKPYKLISTGDDYSTMKFKVEVTNGFFEAFTEDGKLLTIDTTPSIVLATEENCLMLNKMLGVEYEPVKLTGSDLAKKLLKDKPQTCYVSDVSDDIASSNKCIDVIAKFENGGFITMGDVHWRYAVPCNQHGEVLEDE